MELRSGSSRHCRSLLSTVPKKPPTVRVDEMKGRVLQIFLQAWGRGVRIVPVRIMHPLSSLVSLAWPGEDDECPRSRISKADYLPQLYLAFHGT